MLLCFHFWRHNNRVDTLFRTQSFQGYLNSWFSQINSFLFHLYWLHSWIFTFPNKIQFRIGGKKLEKKVKEIIIGDSVSEPWFNLSLPIFYLVAVGWNFPIFYIKDSVKYFWTTMSWKWCRHSNGVSLFWSTVARFLYIFTNKNTELINMLGLRVKR